MSTAIATLKPTRMPLNSALAKEYDLTPTQWRVLVDQTFPSAKTPEAVIMALEYCRSRKLDVFKKPVHIVPMYSSVLKRMVETVWPSISEIRTTAFRTGAYAGMDEMLFGPTIEREFAATVDQYDDSGNRTGTKEIKKKVSFPEWGSVVVYRIVQGNRYAFHTKIYWMESYAKSGKTNVPNNMWENRPIGQFDKCVEAAALRRAFPEELGNTYAAEEMEGRTIDHDVSEAPTKPTPPKPSPAKPSAPAKPASKQEKQPEPKEEPEQRPSPELDNKDVEEASFEEEVSFEPDEGTVEERVQPVEKKPLTAEQMSAMIDAFVADLKGVKTEDDVGDVWAKHDLMSQFGAAGDEGEVYQAIASVKYNQAMERVNRG